MAPTRRRIALLSSLAVALLAAPAQAAFPGRNGLLAYVGSGDQGIHVAVIGGFGGKDTMDGRGGADVIFGGPGDATIAGDDGNDLLVGGPGKDRLDGGPGVDRCVVGPHGGGFISC